MRSTSGNFAIFAAIRRASSRDSNFPLKHLQPELTIAIGFYLGNPTKAEAPIAAYARALGYEHAGEIIQSAGPVEFVDDQELTERDAQARTRLFIKFGLKLDEANLPEWPAVIEALKLMRAGMSETYRNLANEYLDFDA